MLWSGVSARRVTFSDICERLKLFTTPGGASGDSWPAVFYNAAGTQCCGNTLDQEHYSVGWYMSQAVYVQQILTQ